MLRRQRNLPIHGRPDAVPAGHGPAVPRRSGLTVIEMMVAVVILAVGLLGLVSTAGVVTRQVGGGAKQSVVAQVIANRLERLRSLGCSQIPASGTQTTRGVTESWEKGATVNDVLFVTNTVTYRMAGSPAKSQTFVITVPCQ